MRAVIYSRISGQDDERTRSLDTQEEMARDKAKSMGYTEFVCFRERFTGAELHDRPLLTKARELVRSGSVSGFFAHSVDRLSREPVHLMILCEEFQRNGVQLVFTTESLDETPEGKLVSYVRGYAAKIEREKIRERVARGTKKIVESGQLVGQGKPLYGYRFNKQTRCREIDETQAAVVRRIFQMSIEGHSLCGIRKILNQEGVPCPSQAKGVDNSTAWWNTTTIRKMIGNPSYYGQAAANRRARLKSSEITPLPGTTPAIVSRETWESAQISSRAHQYNPGRPSLPSEEYLLRGIVRCPKCGHKLRAINPKRKYKYYRCSNHTDGLSFCDGTKLIPCDALDDLVWCEIKKILQEPDLFERAIASLPDRKDEAKAIADDMAVTRKKLAETESLSAKVYDQWKSEPDKDLAGMLIAELRKLKQQAREIKEKLQEMTARLTAAKGGATLADRIRESAARARKNLEHATRKDKIAAFHALSLKVTASSIEDVEIVIGDEVQGVFGNETTGYSGSHFDTQFAWVYVSKAS